MNTNLVDRLLLAHAIRSKQLTTHFLGFIEAFMICLWPCKCWQRLIKTCYSEKVWREGAGGFWDSIKALGFQGTSPSGARILQHDQLRKLVGEKPNSFYWKVEL